MLDFAQTGDMRKFPEYSGFWGWWQHANAQYPGQPEQISLERSTLQGWSSDRLRYSIHEGTHSLYQTGPESENTAQMYEDYCVNW